MWMRRAWLVLAAAGCLLLSACSSEPRAVEAISPTLRIATDEASAPLAEGLLNAYEARNPQALLALSRSSRDAVLAQVAAGQVDAGLVLHPLNHSDLFATPLGRELIVLIANHDVLISNLYRRDVRAVFSGQVLAWDTSGGASTPITVVTREQGDSTRLALESLVLEGQPITPSARIAASEAEMLSLVAATPGAVGYVPSSILDDRVSTLEYESAPPALEAAAGNTYRLTDTVQFVSTGEPVGSLRAFLDWIIGDEGQAVVRRYMLGIRQ
jgi:phosphate transport system substrate-binding protein